MSALAPRRVLLVQVRRLGDVTLSTALLADMRAAWPDARLDWLVGAAAAPLLEHHPLIAERIVLRKPHASRLWRPVRARRYDCVVDVQGSVSTATLTRLSGASVRVGWKARGRAWAYTHRCPRGRGAPPEYSVRRRQRLLEQLGLRVGAAPRLHLTDAERAQGAAAVAALGRDGPRVGMQLSTSERAKDWPARRFGEVARELARDGAVPVVLQAPGEAALVAEFREVAADAAVVTPVLPLRPMLGMLAACDAFVSGDTGASHMATALDVPRVTVYGPTNPVTWTPPEGSAVGVRDEAARCAACAAGRRDGVHDCLAGVTAAMVLEPLRDLLRRSAVAAHPTTTPRSDT